MARGEDRLNPAVEARAAGLSVECWRGMCDDCAAAGCVDDCHLPDRELVDFFTPSVDFWGVQWGVDR